MWQLMLVWWSIWNKSLCEESLRYQICCLACYLCCACLCNATINGISDIVLDYLKYPVITNTDITYRSQVDFPAVTICNLNRVNCHNAFQAMFDIKTTIDNNSSLGNTELAMMELTLIQLTQLANHLTESTTYYQVYQPNPWTQLANHLAESTTYYQVYQPNPADTAG